jgi:F420-non-reducing hydrogenase iron-sulfur subunit
VKYLLEQIGLEPGRVGMFNMSAAMAGEFVETASEVSEQITALGPNPLRHSGTGESNVQEQAEKDDVEVER